MRGIPNGCVLTAVWRWTGRLLYAETHRGSWLLSIPGLGREKVLNDFISRAMACAVGCTPDQLSDGDFQKRYPALWAFLTTTEITAIDGVKTPRQTATVNIFLHDGTPKAFLNDRASGRCLSVSCASFTGLFEALEGALTAEHVQWRWMERAPDGKSKTSRRKGT